MASANGQQVLEKCILAEASGSPKNYCRISVQNPRLQLSFVLVLVFFFQLTGNLQGKPSLDSCT